MTSASPPEQPQSKVPDKCVAHRDDDYQMMRDIWSDYNHRQEVEHELIDRKTTWLLTGESLLFTAYGVTLGLADDAPKNLLDVASDFRSAVAWAGLLIAAAMLLALTTIIISKGVSWWRYKSWYEKSDPKYEKQDPELPKPLELKPFRWGVFTLNTLVSLLADVAVPSVFLGIWIHVICVT
jgi:hypothetical protein